MSARTTPPNDNQKCLIPVIRTKPGPGLRVVILSNEWLWAPTHFDGKRTVICNDNPDCILCRKQVQSWKGFVVVREFSGTRHALLSITPNVVDAIKSGRESLGSLAGLVVHFTRLGRQNNSPLAANVQSILSDVEPIPWRETITHLERVFKCQLDRVLLALEPVKDVEWQKLGKIPS